MFLYQFTSKLIQKLEILRESNIHQQIHEHPDMEYNNKVLEFESRVECVHCSSDGELILCAVGKEIRVFNSTLAILKAKLIGHAQRVYIIKVFQNSLIATAGREQTIRLWNAKTFKSISVLQGHEGGSKTVEFCTQSLLISVGYHYELFIQRIPQGCIIYKLQGSIHMVSDTLYLCNEQIIIYTTFCHSLIIWDWKTKKNIKSLHGAKSKDKTFITLNGKVMSKGNIESKIPFCDLRRGKVIRSFDWVHSKNQIAVHPEQKYFIIAAFGLIIFVNLMTGKFSHCSNKQHNQSVQSVTFSADGDYILCARDNKQLSRILVKSLQLLEWNKT